ncbi:unnamed protein product [Cercospora beticola]|nr:unnamed protein product [Cercospora beticola]
MSKRGAGNWGGDEERYGGASGADMEGADKPTQATAAQLARRKLLKPKARAGSERGRSDSPAVQPQVNPFNAPTANPFTSTSFNFTASQPQQSNGTAYQFGQSTPASANPPQQNGANNLFSQSPAPTFGGFGAPTPQTQPQQNGFNASTSLFNQPSQQNSTPSFGGFGQTQSQPSQQNGTTTPATSFGGFSNASQPSNQGGAGMNVNAFNAFGKQQENNNQSSNTFPGFGQKPQENGTPAPGSFNGFGQQTQENGSSRASTPAFGGLFGQKAPEQNDKPASDLFGQKASDTNAQPTNPFNGFNGFGQQKSAESSKSLFPATQAPEQTPKTAATTNMFGQPPSSQAAAPSTGLFGSTTAGSTAPGTGLFGANPSSSTTAPGTGLFGSDPSSNAAASNTGLFGSKPATTEPNKSGASIFDNLPKKDTSSLKINFSSADPSQVYRGEDDDDENQTASPEKDAEKQAAPMNIFGNLGQSQQTPKPASNIFAASSQTPSLFGSTAGQKDANTSTIGATPQKSLFPSSTPAATPAVSSTPATQPPRSLFDRINKPAPEETPKAPLFSATPASTSTVKSLFPAATPAATSTPAATPSLFQKPLTPAEDETPKAAPPKNIFAPSTAAPSTPATAPSVPTALFKAPPATAPVARTTAPPANSASTSSSTNTAPSKLSDSQQASMKALNEGVLAHLRNQRPDVDWSPIYRYALQMAAQIAGRPAPLDAELNPTPTVPPSFAPKSGAFATGPAKSTTTASNAAPSHSALFAQTPKAAPASSSITQVPATAPSKKRLFEEDIDERVPATEKRSKPNETPLYPKLPDTASNTAKLFASTLDKPAASDAAKSTSSSGFTPATKSLFSASGATPSATPATGGFKPTFGNASASTPATTGGFKPTMPAGSAGSSFLSSFGALAKKQEEADRQKRKDNDFDSDEETEEQWAQRDKAEQEEKRRKFEEAAKKAPSFSIGAATPKPATAEAAEKAQGTGDKTWKPESPLKFNIGATTTPAAAPPKFGNLFGSSTANDASSKLSAPATSLDASRATTPGATTDGEAATTTNGDKAAADDGEPSDEPNQPQASDEINDLQPAEREANDVLLEVEDVRTSKMEKDEESGKQIWKPKTRGRFFILKDKSTGKIRMLSRTGAGRTVLNHFANKEATFKVHPKKATMIVASMFVDHLHTNPPGPGQWMFSTPDQDDAAKIAKILTDGTPK